MRGIAATLTWNLCAWLSLPGDQTSEASMKVSGGEVGCLRLSRARFH